ncbi:hypothetical protein B0H13DRAFT_2330063 [Mycena leptocephala]|nr:hypothetical protein B0H13DRAFT_2330063 [Mycena leptocephala]
MTADDYDPEWDDYDPAFLAFITRLNLSDTGTLQPPQTPSPAPQTPRISHRAITTDDYNPEWDDSDPAFLAFIARLDLSDTELALASPTMTYSDSHTCGDGAEEEDDPIPGDDEQDINTDAMETFPDAESFCDALRADFKAGEAVDFHSAYPIPADPLVTPRQRVQMVAAEIWKISSYRWTVKDHKRLASGHRTRFWCSQDEARKKKSKASQNSDVRNRDNMRKNDDEQLYVTVLLKHAGKHVSYVDVSMPLEGLDMIHENVEWLTPVAMVTKVQAAFPQVTAAQIHRAWMEMSEVFWQFDDDQLLSTKKLLEEHSDDVDIFEPEDVPEGVEMLCWGMKKIATPLKGKIVEVGVDATYNTNSKHLELYSIMAEQDGAGFPLSYLLLSTATSIDQGKPMKALTAWAKCVRDKYGVDPQFSHVDKDMAEISMIKSLEGKDQPLLVAFTSRKYEGGKPDTVTPVVPPSQQPVTMTAPNGLRITIHARPALTTVGANGQIHTGSVAEPRVEERKVCAVDGKENEGLDTHDGICTRVGRVVRPTQNLDAADPEVLAQAMKARTTRAAAPKSKKAKAKATADASSTGTSSEDEEEEKESRTRRTFCPAAYREPIIAMMEKHYCAHPLLPGYAHPSPEGIKRWAVLQMYKFCVEHGLREVWAYLWENWYRSSRWEP